VELEDSADVEENNAAEVFEEDELIEQDTSADEAFYTEEVTEDVEEADPNADIYAALADGELVVTEDVVDGQTVVGEADNAELETKDVTATLKNTTFTYGATAEDPSFNYVGVSAGDSKYLKYDGGWTTGVSFVNQTTGDPATGNPGTLDPGTYTVTFTATNFAVDTAAKGAAADYNYKVTVQTPCTITVAKKEVYAKITGMSSAVSAIKYGADVPTYTTDNVTLAYYENKSVSDTDTPISILPADISGDAAFTTTYKKGDKVGTYYVTYSGGLSTTKYNIVPATNCKAELKVEKAAVSVVPKNLYQNYGETPLEPVYTLKDGAGSTGAASLLQNEIAAGSATLSVYVCSTAANSKAKVTDFQPGTYYYSCELGGTSKGNFNVLVDTNNDHTYIVRNAVVTFADYEGIYDGQYHGIIVTPDPSSLPSNVNIYYNEGKNDRASAKTTPVEKVNPSVTTVYYFVEQDSIQTDFGYRTITILDASEGYKAVEAMIDALPAASAATADTKPAADAAKAAYDALTDAQKALIPAAKVQKLNDVKEAADKAAADKAAAKAVEDQIDALPAAEEATAETKPAADAAKEAYDALTDAQKALVPAEKVEKLNAVKEAADKADEEAEEEVEELNQDVKAVEGAKTGAEGKAAAVKAKEAYENLSPDAKAKLTEEEIKDYEKTQEAYREDKEFVAGNSDPKIRTRATYRVLSSGDVTYEKPAETDWTYYQVPQKILHNGFTYRVVRVSKYAFEDCKKATKILIGRDVRAIGSGAFKNTTAMTKLKVRTVGLTTGKVEYAFKAAGKAGSLTVYVPSGKVRAYETLFKSEGGMKPSARFTEEG
jgi:hypothetical protein